MGPSINVSYLNDKETRQNLRLGFASWIFIFGAISIATSAGRSPYIIEILIPFIFPFIAKWLTSKGISLFGTTILSEKATMSCSFSRLGYWLAACSACIPILFFYLSHTYGFLKDYSNTPDVIILTSCATLIVSGFLLKIKIDRLESTTDG